MLANTAIPYGWKTVRHYCGKRGSFVAFGVGALIWIMRWRKKKALRQKAISKRAKEQAYIQMKLYELQNEVVC